MTNFFDKNQVPNARTLNTLSKIYLERQIESNREAQSLLNNLKRQLERHNAIYVSVSTRFIFVALLSTTVFAGYRYASEEAFDEARFCKAFVPSMVMLFVCSMTYMNERFRIHSIEQKLVELRLEEQFDYDELEKINNNQEEGAASPAYNM